MHTVKVDRRELLRFMNSGVQEANGHHTAMTGFMGEPLAVGLILHSLRSEGKPAEFVSWKVTPGMRKGSRLDAWIFDGEGTLYQTEIKMWAGNAIGGLRLKDGLGEDELLRLGQKQWLSRIWNEERQTFHAPQVGKVLGTMQVPDRFKDSERFKIEPLLCLWWLVRPAETEAGAWFCLPVRDEHFECVHVLSLTRYLMGLSEDMLELEMPLLASRFEWLQRIFPDWDPERG